MGLVGIVTVQGRSPGSCEHLGRTETRWTSSGLMGRLESLHRSLNNASCPVPSPPATLRSPRRPEGCGGGRHGAGGVVQRTVEGFQSTHQTARGPPCLRPAQMLTGSWRTALDCNNADKPHPAPSGKSAFLNGSTGKSVGLSLYCRARYYRARKKHSTSPRFAAQ